MRLFMFFLVGGLMINGDAASQAQSTVVFDGNELLRRCLTPSSSARYGFCVGYVAGIAETLHDFGAPPGLRVCIEDGVIHGQLKEVVVNSLQARPQDRHLQPHLLVSRALSQAFPCR
jgi:hypothetical protein